MRVFKTTIEKEDNNMATRKDVRELKVCEVSGYRYQAVPQIQLKGAWLRQYGFSEETPVTVKCSDGQIVITPREVEEDTKPEVPMVAEPKNRYGRAAKR